MKTPTNSELLSRDLSVLWHPCTQMKDHERVPLIPIRRGQGVWLEDFNGKRYLDAISSWWVNLFGHANPTINQALKLQLDELEHVLLAGFSHEPAVELAERLTQLAPPGLTRCFYADNGSSAVEVAIKMSYHYWHNSGASSKTKFVTLSNGYHGETLGALALGDVSLYKAIYKPLLMQTFTVTSPDCYHREAGVSWQSHSQQMFSEMEATLAKHADEICAVVVEPLVQCAGSMRMYHPIYLSLLRQACDKYQVHLIADEIAVGFGRTGTLFACEQSQITPDFLCLSKGLTGGYLPLSAVLTTEQTYQAFYDDYENLTAFLHSHSYTGNPLGCRAALATLDIFERDNIIQKNIALADYIRQACQPLTEHPHVAEVRQTGMITAVEMIKDRENKIEFDWRERRGLKVYEYALEQGVLLRPLGNVIYFMPPYVIQNHEIDLMIETALQGINIATR